MFRELFGKVEIETILKKIKGKNLKQTERNYLSKSIRPKLISINYIARLHLLEEINSRKKRIAGQEIIYNLDRYGYPIIALKKIHAKKIHAQKIPLEELIMRIIINCPQSRFIEAIPFLLLKNKIDSFKLLELALKYKAKNELGYLLETAWLIKNKKELAELLHYLKNSKEKEENILGEDWGKEYQDFLIENSPPRLKSWNLLGRFFDQDFRSLARGYL